MIVRGLVTEPHSKKRTFSIWGVIRNDDAKAWQVITISFENILNRKCKLAFSGLLYVGIFYFAFTSASDTSNVMPSDWF